LASSTTAETAGTTRTQARGGMPPFRLACAESTTSRPLEPAEANSVVVFRLRKLIRQNPIRIIWLPGQGGSGRHRLPARSTRPDHRRHFNPLTRKDGEKKPRLKTPPPPHRGHYRWSSARPPSSGQPAPFQPIDEKGWREEAAPQNTTSSAPGALRWSSAGPPSSGQPKPGLAVSTRPTALQRQAARLPSRPAMPGTRARITPRRHPALNY
jgi:hypothetical protein